MRTGTRSSTSPRPGSAASAVKASATVAPSSTWISTESRPARSLRTANNRTRTVIEPATSRMLDGSRGQACGGQQLDLDTLTGGDAAVLGRDDREGVRAQHRGQDVRTLLLGGPRVPPVLTRLQSHPDEVRPAGALLVGLVEHRARTVSRGAGPRERQERGPDQEDEGHDRRYRVTGEPECEGATRRGAEPRGPTWP